LDSLPEFKENSASHFSHQKDAENESPKPSEKKTWFQLAVDGLKLQTLKNAYVMLLRTSVCNKSVEPSVKNGVFARTDGDGEFLWINELEKFEVGDLEKTSKTRVYFEPGEELIYFWTLSKKAFHAALGDALDDIQAAMQKYEFERVRFVDEISHTNRLPEAEDAADNPFELLDPGEDTSAKLALIREYLVGSPSDSNYRGYYPGYAIRLWHEDPDHIPAYGNYLIAGSRSLNALYLAELTYYHALSLPQQYFEDFAVFAEVKSIIQKSEAGDRYPSLDETTKTFQIGSQTYAYAAWDKYRNYAYICARNPNIPRDLFATAVDFHWTTTSSAWWEAADEIRRREPLAVHPVDHTKPIDKWKTMEVEHVMPLFDFYRFGLDYVENGWYTTVQASEKQLQVQVKTISGRIRDYLAEHVPKSGLAADLEMRYLRNADLCKEIWSRFITLSEIVGHDWSADTEAEKQSKELFTKFAEWSGVLIDKIAEVIDDHYRKIENIMRVWENVEGDVKRIEGFIRRVAEWNEKIQRKPSNNIRIEPKDKHIKKIRLAIEDVDVGRRRAVIKAVTSQGEQVAMELEFLTEDVNVPKKKLVPTRRTQHWKKPKMRVVEKLQREIHVEVEDPFHSVKLWPKGLVVLGETVGLVINSRKLVDQIHEKAEGEIGTTMAKVGRDLFQVIDSSSDLLAACFARSGHWLNLESKLVRVSKIAKVPGAFFEVYVNYHDGAQILMISEDSEAVQAKAEGEELIATLVEVKGVVLVVGTTAGLLAGGAAVAAGVAEAGLAAAGLAFPPLGIALAITAIIVVAIEFSIYLLSGPSNVMADLTKKLRKANNHEFGVQWVTEKTPKKHRTVECMVRFENHTAALLR
jgi:hypothetical protein